MNRTQTISTHGPEAKTMTNREQAQMMAMFPGAFDAFYLDHREPLIRYVRNFIWEAQEVEEVAQDAWLRFHRGLDKFKGDCTPWTYVRQIARYAAYDYIRAKSVRIKETRSEGLMGSKRERGPSVSRKTSYRELLERASERPPKVPEKSWEAFVLHEYEGWTLKRIAAFQDIPEGTAGTRIHAARHRLRKHLTCQGLTPDMAHSTVALT